MHVGALWGILVHFGALVFEKTIPPPIGYQQVCKVGVKGFRGRAFRWYHCRRPTTATAVRSGFIG